MAIAPDSGGNRLLAALPDAEWRRWLPHLEPVSLAVGRALSEPGQTPSHAYFPATAVVSLLCLSENGSADEVAVVGNEGVVGISLFMSGGPTITRAMVQTGGAALRVAARTIEDEFLHSPAVMRLLLHYTMALSTQMAQTVVCSRHHALEQRLCRRLLQGLRRQHGSELVMTQEQLALLLGVRRESITTEAFKLQKAGVVRYSRGHIFVLDREGLEERACECRRVVEREYERLLPLPPSSHFHLLPSVQTAESSGRTMARSGRASMVRPSQRVTS